MQQQNQKMNSQNRPSSIAVDSHVGSRVRVRRKFAGMSQSDLAKSLGLTFQQVQKYESGTNRISASKLYQIGQVLKVPMSYFFDGLPDNATDENVGVQTAPDSTATTLLSTADGMEIAEAFPRIKSAKRRQMIMEMIQALGDDA